MTVKYSPHITKLKVRKRVGGVQTQGQVYILTHLDDVAVPEGALIRITVLETNGVPRNIYIDGGWPLYETWVYLDGTVVAQCPGRLAEKERRTRESLVE